MSPRGFWDWGVNPSGVVTSPEVTLAELAARLGSIARYDRRGEAILLDSFEDSAASWVLVLGAAGSAGTRTTASSRSGGYAYQLTTAAVLNDSVALQRFIAPHTLARFGCEASFTLASTLDDGAPAAQYVYLDISVFDGTNVHNGGMRINGADGQVAVLTTGGTYSNVGSALNMYARSVVYHTAKLVIDVSTNLYARLFIDGQSLPVSTVALSTAASATRPIVRAVLTLQTRAAAAISNRWDDVILTQNEP